MTGSEARGLWVYLQQHWPQYQIPTDERVAKIRETAWLDTLGDMPALLVQAAILAIGPRDHPPSPQQLRAAALKVNAVELEQEPIPDVDQALAEVLAEIHRVGRYGTPVWSHPAIDAAVKAMGWWELCGATDPGILRGQFTKLYGVAHARVERLSYSLPPLLAHRFAGVLKLADDLPNLGDGS